LFDFFEGRIATVFQSSRWLIGLAGSLVVLALIISSGQGASAQDSAWHNMGSGVEPESDSDAKAPLDLSGCWSGSIDDHKFGDGSAFLFFDQEGDKAVSGTSAGIDAGSLEASGPLTGTIKSSSFKVSFKKKGCNISFSGKMPSADHLSGGYKYSCDKIATHGTFEFTFDSSGTTC
jgi:hypothetical protein